MLFYRFYITANICCSQKCQDRQEHRIKQILDDFVFFLSGILFFFLSEICLANLFSWSHCNIFYRVQRVPRTFWTTRKKVRYLKESLSLMCRAFSKYKFLLVTYNRVSHLLISNFSNQFYWLKGISSQK